MNERIWEIWRTDVHRFARRQQLVDQDVIEKFAELIIREYSYDCMDVTSNSEHIQFVAKKWGVEL